MIFKQIPEILSGAKMQTRRVVKANQFYSEHDEYPNGVYSGENYDEEDGSWDGNARRVYIIGHTYAVVPKRGMPGVVWHTTYSGDASWMSPYWDIQKGLLKASPDLWHPLRIRITAIRQERLQAISEADAKAEGVKSVEAYRALWEAINGKTPGARWADNPLVFVLTFEVVREVQS